MIRCPPPRVYTPVNYASVPAVVRISATPPAETPAAVRPDDLPAPRGRRQASSSTRDLAAHLLEDLARRRSEAAFADLFDLYAGRLKHFFVRGGIDVDRAEELTQEVLLTVWRRADSFDRSRASALTWLYTLARNRRIDELRLRDHAAPRPEDLAWDATCPASTEGALEASERHDALRKALVTLPEEQRTVLHHMFFQGRSLADIAQENATPLGTVKSRARLALERLRRALQQHKDG